MSAVPSATELAEATLNAEYVQGEVDWTTLVPSNRVAFLLFALKHSKVGSMRGLNWYDLLWLVEFNFVGKIISFANLSPFTAMPKQIWFNAPETASALPEELLEKQGIPMQASMLFRQDGNPILTQHALAEFEDALTTLLNVTKLLREHTFLSARRARGRFGPPTRALKLHPRLVADVHWSLRNVRLLSAGLLRTHKRGVEASEQWADWWEAHELGVQAVVVD